MSIIVKGMDMPENCIECISSDLRTAIKCTEWTEISAGRRENERAWSCPLVALPDKHGRLVDADALIEDVDGDLTDSIAEGRAIEKIMDAPTIVEPEDES